VGPQIVHARTLVALVGRPEGRWLDLGSGAGLPGLVLALAWEDLPGVLLDAHGRRAAFAREAVSRLGLEGRVVVHQARAEDAARDPALRGGFALVVARGFGAPATTAECAVGFLAASGRLAVSEPPEGETGTRWPPAGLARLGLAPAELRRGAGATVAVMRATGSAPDGWPRRQGVPGKRPLW
jgi:16S rRNA (guanine527-N7)-methyltransferase